ncbi:SDR family NAD(P)-dependent oxidoreductase [Streptococcus saliviloxodontae]|uniref:Short-subunit dehydrogenase n=1 Tax=Streptococcus saliviloxodontae TaxID=1349416 RepID=A0ABS2PMK5_9STRE|nr:SDR family NAD(P)-dependent oxidoreductase [Streptococcus saliviloxodontae]MBM7636668.1 short-subunit dehydrogenase [Streptococcus saliviloxodontae]
MTKSYAVVTGASSGIGREAAKALAKRGHHLILVARREAALLSLKEDILAQEPDLDIILRPTDLSQADQVDTLYDFISDYDLDMLLNIAGLGQSGAIVETDLVSYEQLLAVNVHATMTLSSRFAKDYAQKSAQLINVSSAVGYVIAKDNVIYSASKFFINAFTQGLANEMADSPLQVKIFAPALTATDFIEDMGTGDLSPFIKPVNEVVAYLLQLIDSSAKIGLVNEENTFVLTDKLLPELNSFGE